MSKNCDEVCLLVEKIFPHIKIKKEEFVLYKGQKLFLDLWLPQLNIIIEVHGRQHDEFVEHFHGTGENFRAAKKRDRIKEEWAALNGYTFIVIREKDLPLTESRLLEMIDEASRSDE